MRGRRARQRVGAWRTQLRIWAGWRRGRRGHDHGRCGGGAAGAAEGRHRGRRQGLGVPRGGSWSRGPVMRGVAAGEAEGRHEVREVEALSREAGGVG